MGISEVGKARGTSARPRSQRPDRRKQTLALSTLRDPITSLLVLRTMAKESSCVPFISQGMNFSLSGQGFDGKRSGKKETIALYRLLIRRAIYHGGEDSMHAFFFFFLTFLIRWAG